MVIFGCTGFIVSTTNFGRWIEVRETTKYLFVDKCHNCTLNFIICYEFSKEMRSWKGKFMFLLGFYVIIDEATGRVYYKISLVSYFDFLEEKVAYE